MYCHSEEARRLKNLGETLRFAQGDSLEERGKADLEIAATLLTVAKGRVLEIASSFQRRTRNDGT
jgi:hypothetical protein